MLVTSVFALMVFGPMSPHVAAFLWCVMCAYVVIVAYKEGVLARLGDATLRSDLTFLGLPTTDAYSFADVARHFTWTTDLDGFVLETVFGAGGHTKLKGAVSSLSLVSRELSVAKTTSVLDIGCGRGFCTLTLAGEKPDVCFTGIDLVPRHVQVARSVMCENAVFLRADAMRFLSTAIHGFDVVYGIDSLRYMDTQLRLKNFMWRCKNALRPGGRLVIIDIFRADNFEAAPRDQQAAMRLAEGGMRIEQMPSKAQWKFEANRQGLRLAAEEDLTTKALPFWTQLWRIARVVHRLGLIWWLPKETVANLASMAAMAHAMRQRAAAEYCLLVFVVD